VHPYANRTVRRLSRRTALSPGLGLGAGVGRRGLGSNRAYNVSGSQGVRLHLRSGDAVVIGSQRSQELALAIDTRLPRS
jgi:hypothetical protein